MRDRAGSGKTIATLDVQTEGGIIADGHLSFMTKVGEPFTATLEATSFDTFDEIKYKTQGRILAWDSFAVGSLITAFVFSYSYAFNQFTIHKIGLLASVILLIASLIIMTGSYYFLFRWMQRYRYIYAIEQFKKYHADEQWIAIGESIFDGPENKYLKELKAQCVYNGFGLVVVDHELRAQLLITPSRREVFGEKRKALKFDDRDVSLQRTPTAKLKRLSGKVLNKLPKSSRGLFKTKMLGRYQKGFGGQILLTVFSLGLLLGIFIKQLDDKPFNYVNEQEYLDSMKRYSAKTFPEYEEVAIDTPWVDAFRKEKGYLALDDSKKKTTRNIEAEGWDSFESSPLFEKEISEVKSTKAGADNQIILSTEAGDVITYNCTRLRNMHGKYYLIQDNIYSSFQTAQKRIRQSGKEGIPLNAFCMGCLQKGNTKYIVHYDFFFEQRAEAVESAKVYKKRLNKTGVKDKKILIRSVTFK